MKFMHFFKTFFLASCFVLTCYADNSDMTLFPIEDYSQNVNQWVNPSLPGYYQNLLSKDYQQKKLSELVHEYFGTDPQDNSPWSSQYIRVLLNQPNKKNHIVYAIKKILEQFDNSRQSGNTLVYGANYRLYNSHWIDAIEKNIRLSELNHLHYSPQNRAIAVENLSLRALPTDDPAYFSSKIAGEGYPFDNLQSAAVYVGTSLYILSATMDKSWFLVLTPECIGWLKASGVAKADHSFIERWQKKAYEHLVGIKQSNVSIRDAYTNHQFFGYVGMIFPMKKLSPKKIEILIPAKKADGIATIHYAQIALDNIAVMPLSASKANFAHLFKTLQGRPYGWGNSGFYNDCSAEMKAIFTLFGFFMPRNTQSQILVGKLVDISDLKAKERADYLIKNGIPLLTLIHLKGHILLYVGTYKDKNNVPFALSYQQVWGLYPKDKSSRSIIGQAVFLPLLLSYPQDTHLISQLDNNLFQLIYLNQFSPISQQQRINSLFDS